MEKLLHARLVSRVFAAPRSQSWAKTRHVISGAIQEVQWLSRLSKHIYLRGKDFEAWVVQVTSYGGIDEGNSESCSV